MKLGVLAGMVAILCLSLSSRSMAAVGCQGVVNKVMVQPEGTVFVDFGYSRLYVCSLNGNLTVNRGASFGGSVAVTPATCQGLLASFMTAKATAKPIIAYVDRSDCNFTDGELPTPYPYFFYFLEQ